MKKYLMVLALLLLVSCEEAFADLPNNCKVLRRVNFSGAFIYRCVDEVAICTYAENVNSVGVSCFPTPKSKN